MRPRSRVNVVNRCIKYLLFLCNVLFWIAFMLLLAIGVVAYVLSEGLPPSKLSNNFWWMLNITILIMIAGCVGTVLSFTGCVGSLRENVCLLKVYTYSLLAMFLCECILLALAVILRGKAMEGVEDITRDAFIKEYREPGNEDTTNFVDWLQRELQCCGPKGYRDWQVNRYFACQNNTSPEACGVPFSCCRAANDVSQNIINTACGYRAQKLAEMDARDRVWTTGCVGQAVYFIQANMYPAMGIVTGIALFQLLAIYFSRSLATQISTQWKLVERHGAAP